MARTFVSRWESSRTSSSGTTPRASKTGAYGIQHPVRDGVSERCRTAAYGDRRRYEKSRANSEDQQSCENLLSNDLNPGRPGNGGKAGGGERSRLREIRDEMLKVATVVAVGSSDCEAVDSLLDRPCTTHLHRCVRGRNPISVDAWHDGLYVPSPSLFVVPFDDDAEIVFTRDCRRYLPLFSGC
jgi:hypothetical protein